MSSRLDDFIKNNREQFDDLEPADELWQHIERGLPRPAYTERFKKKTFSFGFVLRVAATVILIMAIGFTGYLKLSSRVDLAAINPDYAQQQAHYASLVETKRSALKAVTKADPQLYKEFDTEFARMDSVYKRLRNELSVSPDREKVLRAMIQNLQIQTQVLNQQLNMVQQYNNMKLVQRNEIKNV
ncbi:hypothetical protein [Mucilaginibacter sp. HD30]